jgi:hypothetical protein
VIFGVFEYSRSWQFYKLQGDTDFPRFVVDRLSAYYATSINNGEITLKYGHYVGQFPNESLGALWTTPGLAQLHLYSRLSGLVDPGVVFPTLWEQYGAPQFTNPGGLQTPLYDFGRVGGCVYMAIAGLVLGIVYRAFRESQPMGLFLYPILFTGVLEIPRYVYWPEGRVVPSYVALLLVGIALYRARGRPLRGSGAVTPT